MAIVFLPDRSAAKVSSRCPVLDGQSHINHPKGGRIDPVVPDGAGHGQLGGIAMSVIDRTESCTPIGYTPTMPPSYLD